MKELPETHPQSLSEKILWAQANFFLQLFLWGALVWVLLLLGSATFLVELFGFLALVSAAIGGAFAVVPLWVILYPVKLVRKPKTHWAGPGLSPRQSWLVVLVPIAAVVVAVVISAL